MRKMILVSAGLALAQAGLAQPPAGPGGAMPDNDTIFQRNDANKDGEITLAEAQAAGTQLGQVFATFDLNGDGKVVASELDTMRARMAGGGPGGPPGAAAGAPGAGGPPQSESDQDSDSE